jgi:hypothetical protein
MKIDGIEYMMARRGEKRTENKNGGEGNELRYGFCACRY